MAKYKALYPFTSPRYSAERMGLYKLEKTIDILTKALEKLDEDTAVADSDYAELLKELKDLKESIRTIPNEVK